MREMNTLSPITYNDTVQGLRLSCYADTFVYHKASGSERNLVTVRVDKNNYTVVESHGLLGLVE